MASDAGKPTDPPTSAIPNLKNRIPKLEPRRRRAPRSPTNATPVPETPVLPPPPDPSSITFQVPKKRILGRKDQDLFASSPSYTLILAFIFGLSDGVKDTPVSAVKEEDLSTPVQGILEILEEAEGIIQDTPPADMGGSRFGNESFRTFIDKARAASPSWHHKLGITDPDAIAEVESYLNESYGNRKRIDYGSGHELNFMMWLLCLYQLQILKTADFKALVLRVFPRYLELMRKIQVMYYVEPAGSHGVWGLDDYQFLPFLFGASQLRHHPWITPRSIHQELTVEEYSREFLYLGQVSFVNSTKTVKSLRWHSPMLDDISAAKNWEKIEDGMKRMFLADVLQKLPVMQHFLFGSLIPAMDEMSVEEEKPKDGEDEQDDAIWVEQDGNRHLHHLNSWNDCCGIRVPSAIGASQEMKKHGAQETLRRIPFD